MKKRINLTVIGDIDDVIAALQSAIDHVQNVKSGIEPDEDYLNQEDGKSFEYLANEEDD